MREEVTATVQLIYDCPAEASLSAQSDMIHNDIVRLLDADTNTGVQLSCLTIQHVQSEAMTYGNTEPRPDTRWQCDQMSDLLASAYPDAESTTDALMFALCDLRHMADQENLAFGLWDKSAYRIYRAEREVKLSSDRKAKP